MNIMTVTTEYVPGGENERAEVAYRLRDGQWHVRGPEADEYEPFANGDANERTVRQLIRKEYDCNY